MRQDGQLLRIPLTDREAREPEAIEMLAPGGGVGFEVPRLATAPTERLACGPLRLRLKSRGVRHGRVHFIRVGKPQNDAHSSMAALHKHRILPAR